MELLRRLPHRAGVYTAGVDVSAGVELSQLPQGDSRTNSRIYFRGVRSFAVTASRVVTAVGVLESKTSIESSTCSPDALLGLVVRVTTAVTTAVADDDVREFGDFAFAGVGCGS